MGGKFRVGKWLVDPQLNSLSLEGRSVHVEPKVMAVLVCLAEHAGEVVSKERLINSVWAGTFVADDVLTRSISELRKAFGDDAKAPHYIQTIPRSGYRLIAPVSREGAAPAVDPRGAADAGRAIPAARPQPTPRMRLSTWAIALLALAAGGASWLYSSRRASDPSPHPMRVVPFTSFPGREDHAAFSPDGNQLAFVWGGEKDDNPDIYVKSVGGERSLRLTSDPAIDILPAWSPDGQRIAFVRINEGGFSIYTVPALGNGPERKLLPLSVPP